MKSIEQIFIYINKSCNINCITCYSIPNMDSHDMSLSKVKELLYYYASLGAHKITFLGGEPSMYRDLFDVIKIARKLGFSYLRINTNGIFNDRVRQKIYNSFDTVCFSLDGHNARINNKVRKGTPWEKLYKNLLFFSSNHIDFRINYTVSSYNINYIDKMLKFADELQAKIAYFNTVFLIGEASFNNELALDPLVWITTIENTNWVTVNTDIKIAVGYSKKENLVNFKNHFCGAKNHNKKRYIDTDYNEYSCLLFIGDKDMTSKNMESNKLSDKCCSYLSKLSNDQNVVPLCIHYKLKIYAQNT